MLMYANVKCMYVYFHFRDLRYNQITALEDYVFQDMCNLTTL